MAKREANIINALLTICLSLGFICFAFLVLPDALKKSGALPSAQITNQVPQKLSSIISLDTPREKNAPASQGNTARFVPEPPPPPFGSQNAAIPMDKGDAGQDVAGGAGAAIDDTSAESRQMLAADTSQSSSQEGTGGPIEFRSYPISSLAHRESSALDRDLTKGKKSWLATPAGLEADVAFWRDIYGKYDRNKVVLHHPRHLSIVYDVVDLSDIDNDPRLNDVERSRTREKRVEARRDAVTEILRKLAENPPASSLSEEEWRIKRLFHGVDESDPFGKAATDDGVRSQTGQKDKFITGLKYSGRYLGEIESIFESYGMPRELTRLIFVESMFNPQAVSSVGASGIWQFMRDTGKIYVRMNDFEDERNDPITATHAAAKLLRHNYEALGSWPLALNAYNTGRGRIEQAVTALGASDIGKVIREFNHPAYGFASRNFFLEYLAALDVAEHAEKYFGPIEFDKPLRFEVVRTNYNISLPDVARIASIDMNDVMELNPGLGPKVESGQRLLPAGFAIRVPEKKGEMFLAASARAPKSKIGAMKHTVQDGDSLETVARMYGVTPSSILKSNDGISRNLRIGQVVVVPVDRRPLTMDH